MLDRDLSSWDPGPPSVEQAGDVTAVLAAVPASGPPPEPDDIEPTDVDEADDDGDAPTVPGSDVSESAVAT